MQWIRLTAISAHCHGNAINRYNQDIMIPV